LTWLIHSLNFRQPTWSCITQISKAKPAIQLFPKKKKIIHFTHLNANGVSGLADLGYRGAAWRQDHEKLIDRPAGTHRIVRACVPLMLSVGLLPAELPLE
jgi:hypothetical protein